MQYRWFEKYQAFHPGPIVRCWAGCDRDEGEASAARRVLRKLADSPEVRPGRRVHHSTVIVITALLGAVMAGTMMRAALVLVTVATELVATTV